MLAHVLTGNMCGSQRPGLEFGAAQSYLSLEKLGEGAFASVYKGISRSEPHLIGCYITEPSITDLGTGDFLNHVFTEMSSSMEDKWTAGGSKGDPYEDGGGSPIHRHQRR